MLHQTNNIKVLIFQALILFIKTIQSNFASFPSRFGRSELAATARLQTQSGNTKWEHQKSLTFAFNEIEMKGKEQKKKLQLISLVHLEQNINLKLCYLTLKHVNVPLYLIPIGPLTTCKPLTSQASQPYKLLTHSDSFTIEGHLNTFS